MNPERLCDLIPGDRIQVYNPGPRDTGTVLHLAGRLVHVRWDDGTEGYPRRDLIQRVTETADV